MFKQSTYDHLIEMRLTKMAEQYLMQDKDNNLQGADFEERFAIMVDAEYQSRITNRRQRYRKLAALEQPSARIEDINYEAGRTLDRSLIEKLARCDYISKAYNVFIVGKTGCGKTYIANALGNAAIVRDIKTRFVRMPDFLIEMEVARREGNYDKVMKNYTKPSLLILDEWLLEKPNDSECHDIQTLIHRRRRQSSIIFCSQYGPEDWFEQLGGENNPLAESILDRIIHDAYELRIEATDPEHDISMREVYGLKSQDA